MPTLHESIDVDADPHTVWEVLADVSVLPKMSTSTTDVEVDGLLERAGQTFEQTVRFARRAWTSEWRVEEIEPPKLLRIAGELPGGTPYELTEQIESLGAGRTRLSIRGDYDLPFGMLGRLIDRMGAEKRARSEMNEVLQGVAHSAERLQSERGSPERAESNG